MKDHNRETKQENSQTNRKEVEEKLKESEDRYRNIFDQSTFAIEVTTPDGQLTKVNSAWMKLWNFPQEALPKFFKEYNRLKDKQIKSLGLLPFIERSHAGEVVHFPPIQYETVKTMEDQGFKDAEVRNPWVQGHFYPVKSAQGEILEIVGMFEDITERIEAEQALKESQERLKSILDASPDPIIMCDKKGILLYLSPSFSNIFGWTFEELKGKPVPFIPDFDKEASLVKITRMFDTGVPVSEKTKRLTKDGRVLDVIQSAACIHDTFDNCVGMVVNLTDITENRKLEMQLQQAQKIESIGVLAGGIAHDFNNILSAILGFTEMAISDIPEKSPLHSYLEQVIKAGERARDLVDQILTFSRRSDIELKPLKVQLIIKETLKLLRSTIPSTIEFIQYIDPNCGPVFADPTQIHQIIMNLCTNAYHSMRETGGVLKVTLKPNKFDVKEVASLKAEIEPGVFLVLEISDTGSGITKSHLDKIFEPYFTTKKKGEGSGLGLAVVHGIVKSYNGDITVSSEPGKGSTFCIYLPVIKEVQSDSRKREKQRSLPTGNEKILFVDDDESLVRVGKLMLESLGYHVTGLTSSIDALEAFKSKPNSFDLLITDMTMPEMTGDKLSKKILEIRPDFPIILCTGYSDLITPDEAIKIGVREYISKPVIKSALAGIVRKTVDDHLNLDKELQAD